MRRHVPRAAGHGQQNRPSVSLAPASSLDMVPVAHIPSRGLCRRGAVQGKEGRGARVSCLPDAHTCLWCVCRSETHSRLRGFWGPWRYISVIPSGHDCGRAAHPSHPVLALSLEFPPVPTTPHPHHHLLSVPARLSSPRPHHALRRHPFRLRGLGFCAWPSPPPPGGTTLNLPNESTN